MQEGQELLSKENLTQEEFDSYVEKLQAETRRPSQKAEDTAIVEQTTNEI